jgi:chromosome partitioning protein
MKIALIAKKGGVGKTTICLLLHEALRQTGRTIAVRDYDTQGSATKCLQRFGGILAKKGQHYDYLLIDTPPSLDFKVPAAARAIAATAAADANTILIPTSPSPVDIWEAEEIAQFVKEKNPQAIVRIVLNRTRTGTVLTGAVAESLKGTSVPMLPAILAERQSYQHALVGGWAALDPKAEREFLHFTVTVTTLQ